MNDITIKYLADCPEQLDTLAAWHHTEWQHLNPDDTVKKRMERMRTHVAYRQVPVTLVAFDGDTVLGSASLVECDMHEHRELSPWLASVYVDPPHRGRGVGSMLVRQVTAEARQLGFAEFYLFTPDREQFYTRLGWQLHERTTFRGLDVVIMKLDLTKQDGPVD